MEAIRAATINRDSSGAIKSVRLVFGPHYFVDLVEEGGKVTFVLGFTHHGFKADASVVSGELEQFIGDIRERHPNSAID